MTRRALVAAACSASICCAGAAGPLAGGALASAKPRGPANLLVYAQEWSLWPSRTKLPAGAIDVELWNRGQDAHDLRARRLNSQGEMVGRVAASVRITRSGAISHAVWHLKPGRYEIYCSLPGHLAMGMHAEITVKPS